MNAFVLRRWGQQIHHLNAPHYTMSIVRGRGADLVALRYLARHHDPARVIFVDGWTGKGTITRALAHAATGWSHPTVARTQASGVNAGAEILRWLYAAAQESAF